MFSHVNLGISDFDRAFRFYDGLTAILGLKLRFSERDKGWAGWQTSQGGRPLLLIAKPFDGRAAAPGNGQMIALLAPVRATVDRAYSYALERGGTDEGAPGTRP